jgi:hypothetical protein
VSEDDEGQITRRFVHRALLEHFVAEHIAALDSGDAARLRWSFIRSDSASAKPGKCLLDGILCGADVPEHRERQVKQVGTVGPPRRDCETLGQEANRRRAAGRLTARHILLLLSLLTLSCWSAPRSVSGVQLRCGLVVDRFAS